MRTEHTEAAYFSALLRALALMIPAALAGGSFSTYGRPSGGFAVETVSPAPETVWRIGDRTCKQSRVLALEILLEQKIIYSSRVGLCRVESVEKLSNNTSSRFVFSFSGGHTFQGLHRTKRTERIEGNIWVAGEESDGVLLGISFSIKDDLLLYSVHFAVPDRLSESRLDSGLIVRTRPISTARKPNS